MKRIRTIAVSGVAAAVLAIGGAAAAVVGTTPEPAEQVIWYKDIAAAYPAGGVNNAFDYTELSEKIPEIEPKDRQAILALSEEQINSMTTGELLVTCLDYPLFGDFCFYDNAVVGFERVVDNYNGLQALLARDDVGEAAYSFYSAVDLEKVIDTDDFGSLRLNYLTLLISDDRVLENMTSELRQRLVRICAENCAAIYENYNGKLSYIFTARLAGKILFIESDEFKSFAESSEAVGYFLETGTMGGCSDEDWNKIVQFIAEYI